MSPRRLTLSTVGVLPNLERLATEPLMPNLAISLHSTTEDQRDPLVPANRQYGLEGLCAMVPPPLNAAEGIPVERPSDERGNRFARILADRGVAVSVRKSRGRDIRAACGQLITESTRTRAPGQQLASLMGVRS